MGRWLNIKYSDEEGNPMELVLRGQVSRELPSFADMREDVDPITTYEQVVKRRNESDWKAGKTSITEEVINRDLEELIHFEEVKNDNRD
jgi:hypothetical protein